MRRALLLFACIACVVAPCRAGEPSGPGNKVVPRLASNGSDFLLAWSDDWTDVIAPVVRSQRLTASGTPDPASIGVLGFNEGAVPDAYLPGAPPPLLSSAFGSNVYLVAWKQGDNIVARRLSRSGVTIDSSPIILGAGALVSDQAIAWNGTRFLVVWDSPGFGGGGIVAAFVDENGSVSSPQTVGVVLPLGSPRANGRVLWDGRYFILTYAGAQYYSGPFHGLVADRIVVARLDADGSLVDAPEAAPHIPAVLPSFFYNYAPQWHLATSGVESVIVVSGAERVFGPVNTRAIVVHADTATLVLDPPQILFSWFAQMTSDVVRTSGRYVVAIRYGTPAADAAAIGAAQWWIGALPFVPGGPQPVLASTETNATSIAPISPAIAATASGQTLIAFTDTVPGQLTSTIRTATLDSLREVGPPAPPVLLSAVKDASGTMIAVRPQSLDTAGYIVEVSSYGPQSFIRAAIVNGADPSSFLIQGTFNLVRVRAFSAGGVSEPSPSMPVGGTGRRRAARH